MKKYEKAFNWDFNENEDTYLLSVLDHSYYVAELKHVYGDEWTCAYSIDGKFEGDFSIDEDGIHDDFPYSVSIYAKDVEDAKGKSVDEFYKYCDEEITDLIRIDIEISEKIRKLRKYKNLAACDLSVGEKVSFDFWDMYKTFEDDEEGIGMEYCKVELEYIKLPDDEPGEPAWDNVYLLDRETNQCVLDTLNDECYVEGIYADYVLFKNVGFGDERYFKLSYDVIFETMY